MTERTCTTPKRYTMNHNIKQLTKEKTTLLKAALGYARRGWSIIPIARGQKKAKIKWKPYQTCRPTEETLLGWFGSGTHEALAVILGTASGGLACRDFDSMEAYGFWATAHPDLAKALPTVETSRGRHVYFQTHDLRFEDMGDGEYRADSGHYCLLPPSRHPDGHEYRWLIELPDGPLPLIADVRAAGFLGIGPGATEDYRDNLGRQRNTEAIIGERSVDSDDSVGSGALCCMTDTLGEDELPTRIESAIFASLPTGPGRRNSQVMVLARALKGVAELADAPAQSLREYVRRWHEQALPVIGTQPFEETWIDFLRAWPRAKFPLGGEPIRQVFEAAKRAAIPSIAMQYEQPQLRLLVALCRQLQLVAGDQPFFLSCRTAGSLLGVDHTTAWRWLFLLKEDGLLEETEKGSGGRSGRADALPPQGSWPAPPRPSGHDGQSHRVEEGSTPPRAWGHQRLPESGVPRHHPQVDPVSAPETGRRDT